MDRRSFFGLAPALSVVVGYFKQSPSNRRPRPGQPRPYRTRLAYMPQGLATITAIWRHWKPGESGMSGTCQLCERCRAFDNSCVVLVDRRIEKTDAPMFSTVGLKDASGKGVKS